MDNNLDIKRMLPSVNTTDGSIVVYKSSDGVVQLDVQLADETVWLTLTALLSCTKAVMELCSSMSSWPMRRCGLPSINLLYCLTGISRLYQGISATYITREN